MKVLVCGSRKWPDPVAVRERIRALAPGTLVITGGAPGVDTFAEREATQCGLFVARIGINGHLWTRYGKAAGPLRNRAMLDLEPNLVIAFHYQNSNGTQDTITEAQRRGCNIEVVRAE